MVNCRLQPTMRNTSNSAEYPKMKQELSDLKNLVNQLVDENCTMRQRVKELEENAVELRKQINEKKGRLQKELESSHHSSRMYKKSTKKEHKSELSSSVPETPAQSTRLFSNVSQTLGKKLKINDRYREPPHNRNRNVPSIREEHPSYKDTENEDLHLRFDPRLNNTIELDLTDEEESYHGHRSYNRYLH
ncbi:hypothetical protein M3Y98_00190800 [Aphelenchoides besseyi]|nr:hypothetical protein M3Y98_00190800 [Aphelenchoides besseyi]KAI6200209.1 hypothetical protein M3Y96_00708700 [Aphelenchoides besseyi]